MNALRRVVSLWYFIVPIATIGLFAFVPFVHAAVRLRERRVVLLALAYGAVDVGILAGTSILQDGSGRAPWPFAIAAIIVVVAACAQLSGLRRRAYAIAAPQVAPVPAAQPAAVDPHVASALAARERRTQAKQLVESDPLLARDLGIGRPDLARGYDDGGLVDLAGAPAEVIARVCGLTEAEAALVVDNRGRFQNIDELLVIADLPVSQWGLIRDRGVVFPVRV
ncbi:hypothetical protein [Actinokineospora bangkokensis]|uniref:hypothetical protein n=1 Tax=Actinokineospora bangkokensis TaxID=1193682 RepID=UPI000ADB6F5A|nr:hypothetical protein [Actinokineospora bangkokensis]